MTRLCLAALLGLAPALTLAAGTTQPAAAPAKPGTRAASPGGASPSKAASGDTKRDEARKDAAEVTYAYLKAPFFSDKFGSFPVATVDDEVVTIQELSDALASMHGAHKGETSAGKKDFTPVLERLIDARLIILEARDTGVDELPEVKKSIEDFKESTAREMLQAKVVKGVKADPAQVETVYRRAIREWKVRSVISASEDDARKLEAAMRAGRSMEAASKQLIADKKAVAGSLDGEFLPRSKLLPQVLEALDAKDAKPGTITSPLKVPGGFAVLQVVDVRYPDDSKIRGEAERASLADQQKQALKRYYDGLVKKYARIDQKLLAGIDFEAPKPGIEALKKDQRVIARIQGAKPITVAELTTELERSFWHGIQGAIAEKRVNSQKAKLFDGILSRRIIPLQARRDGIPDGAEYRRRVLEYENSLLFSKFVEQSIAPTVKVSDDEARRYYDQHRSEFTYPTFYKLESTAFASVKDAQAAIEKLRAGTDFKWLNANAEGQVPERKRTVRLDGGTVAASALPAELAKALTGAKVGDYRLYAASDSEYDVVHVLGVTAAQDQPFAEAKDGIAKTLFGEQLNRSMQEWAGKLRKARDVNVFITRIGS